MRTELTGVVLAGGMGRRLGQDKTRLRLPDRAGDLLGRAAALLLGLGLETRIACAPDQVDRAERCALPLIPDLFPRQGALLGVYSALKQVDGPCLMLACDMPFLREQELRALLDLREKNRIAQGAGGPGRSGGVLRFLWREAASGRPEALAALYEREALPFFEQAAASGDLALRRAVPDSRSLFLEYGPEQARYFLNVNRPEDLALALRLAAKDACP